MSKKGKSSTPQVQSGPFSIAEPPYQALPAFLGGPSQATPQNMPGQLELIAQQLHTGYPSMPQAALLKQLQGVYKPPAVAAAVAKAQAAPAKPVANPGGMSDAEYNYWHNYHGKGYGQGAMFDMPSDFLKFLMAQGPRNVNR